MTASTVAPAASRRTSTPEILREVAQILAAFLLYNLGRMLATHELGRADAHAHDVVDVERWLRLPAEATLQTWALGHEWMVDIANHYWLDGIAGSILVLAALWVTRAGTTFRTWHISTVQRSSQAPSDSLQ